MRESFRKTHYWALGAGAVLGLLVSDWSQADSVPDVAAQIRRTLERLKTIPTYEEWAQSVEYPAHWFRESVQGDPRVLCAELMSLRNDDLAVFQSVIRDSVTLPCQEKILKKLESSFATMNLFASVSESKTNSFFGQREISVSSWNQFLESQKHWIRSGEWVLVFISDPNEKRNERIQKALDENQITAHFFPQDRLPQESARLWVDAEDWRKTNPSQLIRSVLQKIDANEKGVIVFRDGLEQTSASFRSILGELQKRRIRFVNLNILP